MLNVTKVVKSILILSLLVSTAVLAKTNQSIEVKVNGLVCAFCAQGITKAFQGNDATDEVWVSLENQLVAIALKPDQDISDEAVIDTLTNAGYDVVSIERTNRTLAMIQEDVNGNPQGMQGTGEMMHGSGHNDGHGSGHNDGHGDSHSDHHSSDDGHNDHHRPDGSHHG